MGTGPFLFPLRLDARARVATVRRPSELVTLSEFQALMLVGGRRRGRVRACNSKELHALRARPAMAKPKKKREIIHLVCSESGDRNYTIRKKPGTPKLELKKYCPRLRRHTVHTEKKK